MEFGEKTIEEKNIYNGKIVKLDLEVVELPNGKTSNREIVRHPGGVAILAFKDQDTVLFVEQFRKPLDKAIYELPAGKLEYGEDSKTCAERELEEETGYKAESLEYLGKIVSSPGFCDEYIYIYKAEKLYQGKIGGDEDEFINIHEFRMQDIKRMIKSGEIFDAKTICAFMYI